MCTSFSIPKNKIEKKGGGGVSGEGGIKVGWGEPGIQFPTLNLSN